MHRAKGTALLLLACLLLLSFDFSPYFNLRQRFTEELSDLGHVAVFFLIGWGVWQLINAIALSRRSKAICWIGVVIGLAGLTEYLQTFTDSRIASWTDIRRDLLGLALFLAFSPRLPPASPVQRQLTRFACIIWLAIELIPVTVFLQDYWSIRRHPNILADFESAGQASRWNHGKIIQRPESDEQSLFKVPLTTDEYSGTSLKYLPRDWSRWSTFYLEVFCADPSPQTLHLKIDDRQTMADGNEYSMRFNTTRTLLPGWNRLTIPIDEIRNGPERRPLNLADINSVSLFFARRSQPGYMLLDNLRLE